jgi:predicted ATP-dependent endonuclease of OLD family
LVILDLLRKYVKENSNQALVITHSPFLLRRNTLNDTWRVTRKKAEGTIVLRVMQAIAKLDPESPRKILQQLDSADVRSLLFSRGAVFVEGLTDKWILQEIDRKVSLGKKEESLVEKEWVVVSMNTSNNAPTFLKLAELLGLNYAFLLDGDAEPIVRKILRARGLQQIDENAMRKNGFFLLRTDIDDLFIIKERNKPWKGLERALSIGGNEIPSEFNEFLAFQRRRTKSGENLD